MGVLGGFGWDFMERLGIEIFYLVWSRMVNSIVWFYLDIGSDVLRVLLNEINILGFVGGNCG